MQRHVLGMKADQLVGSMLHVADKIARTDAAVVLSNDLEIVDIGDLIGRHDNGTEAEERVDTFSAREISRVLLQDVERGQVESRRIAEDHLRHVSESYVLACLADNDSQLALCIDVVANIFWRQHDLALRRE